MVAEFLTALLRANLAGGAGVLLVLALRKPAQRLVGAKAAYRLWALAPLAALAVLLPPRTFEARSLDATPVMMAGPVFVAASATPQPAAARPVAVTAVRLTPAAANLSPDVMLAAWLAGVGVSIGVLAFRQRRFAARLGRLRRGADGVFLAERAGVGPAVVGAIAPRVVAPADFEQRFTAEERVVVLAHERIHLARQDARANGLLALARCLCWFNPMAHVAGYFIRLDQELACDAEVMARFPSARRRYAEALLKTQISVTPLPIGCYWPARAAHPLEERIAMLKNPPPGAGRRIVGLAATIALCLAGGVAAWASQPAQPVVAKVAAFSSLPRTPAPHLTAAPAAAAPPQAAPDVKAAGDWIGSLKSPDLRLAIHIRPSAAGGLTGTLDSPDQHAYDLPLAQIAAADGSLSFVDVKNKGSYAGKWDDTRHAWIGSWSQLGKTWSLDLTAGGYPPDPQFAGLDGGWDTTLTGSAGPVRIGFNIRTDAHGTHGTLDSPDQNSYGVPLTAINRSGDAITITQKAINLSIVGTLSADGQTITGAFTQWSGSVPVVLSHRAPGAAAPYPPPHPLAQAAKPPIVDVDGKVLAAYVGVYRFAPGLEMTVTADGGHLYSQITNQPKVEIFASSPTEFFWKQVDAQATFATPSADRSPYVILHQGTYLLGQRE